MLFRITDMTIEVSGLPPWQVGGGNWKVSLTVGSDQVRH